jgi:hypothetical protein
MLILLFCMLVNVPSTSLLVELRNNYGACSKSEQLCDKMLAKLKNTSGPTEKGYQASFTMMKANWATWPNQKLAYFNEGKDLLEKTIKANSTNIELRFLRYSLQKEIPSFLNYDNKIEDLAYIKKNVASLSDEHLKQKIQSYIK